MDGEGRGGEGEAEGGFDNTSATSRDGNIGHAHPTYMLGPSQIAAVRIDEIDSSEVVSHQFRLLLTQRGERRIKVALYDPLVIPKRRTVSCLKPQGGRNGGWGLHRCLTMTDEVEQHVECRVSVRMSVCQRVSRVVSGEQKEMMRGWD